MGRMLGKTAHQRANACGCCPELADWKAKERRKSRRSQRRREKFSFKLGAYSY